MGVGPIKIVQITDIHLFGDKDKELLGVKTQKSLEAVIDLLDREKEPMDVIILSGDLSQDESRESYERLASMLKHFRVPIYYIAGNHDDGSMINSVYPRDNFHPEKELEMKGWNIILLNSQKPNAVEGYLDQKELEHLKQSLQQHLHQHTLIVLHHQPMPVGCEWLDRLGLANADEFWRSVSQYSQVRGVLFGHVHQENVLYKNNIPCYSTPSTCIQFKRNQNDFRLEKIPPGYRWMHLYNDGRIETGVKRVPAYVGVFEADAEGY